MSFEALGFAWVAKRRGSNLGRGIYIYIYIYYIYPRQGGKALALAARRTLHVRSRWCLEAYFFPRLPFMYVVTESVVVVRSYQR